MIQVWKINHLFQCFLLIIIDIINFANNYVFNLKKLNILIYIIMQSFEAICTQLKCKSKCVY